MGFEVILAGASLFFGAAQALQQRKAAKKAEETTMRAAQAAAESAALQEKAATQQEAAASENLAVSRQNVAREEAENAERQRRQEKQLEQEEALTRARAAASGFKADEEGDTIALALSSQQRENAAQLAWEKAAGVSRADILKRSGDVAYQVGLSQATATRAGAQATTSQMERLTAEAGQWGAKGKAAIPEFVVGSLKHGKTIYDWWNRPTTRPT